MTEQRNTTLVFTTSPVALALLLLLIMVTLATATYVAGRRPHQSHVHVNLTFPSHQPPDYYHVLKKAPRFDYTNKPLTPPHYVYTEH